MSVASKMIDMRNDLLVYSKKANKFSKPSPWQSLVFQFDINLFPLLDKSKEKKSFELTKIKLSCAETYVGLLDK
ncbi:MAG: hypothetical protein V4654_08955 [Bdellovibrionota bacterium]